MGAIDEFVREGTALNLALLAGGSLCAMSFFALLIFAGVRVFAALTSPRRRP